MSGKLKPVDWDQERKKFVKDQFRKASFKWRPRGEAVRAARVERAVNTATGRLCWFSGCALCSAKFLEKEGKLDHVEPVVDPNLSSVWLRVPEDLRTTFALGSYVRRMLAGPGGWQVLCKACHERKTDEERDARTKVRREDKARASGARD